MKTARPLAVVAVFLAATTLAAGCASAEAARRSPERALFTLPLQAVEAPPDGADPLARDADCAWMLRIRMENEDGSSVSAPVVITPAGETATMFVGDSLAFVRTFDVESVPGAAIANPRIGTMAYGVTVAARVAPSSADRGPVALSWSVSLSSPRRPMENFDFRPVPDSTEVTVQLPAIETSLARGVRAVEPGVTSLLAVIPNPDGEGTVSVTVCAWPMAKGDEEAAAAAVEGSEPLDMPAGSGVHAEDGDGARLPILSSALHGLPGGDATGERDPAQAWPPAGETRARDPESLPDMPAEGARTGVLAVRALVLDRDLESGTVLDEAAARRLLQSAKVEVLREFHAVTALVPGAHLGDGLAEAEVEDFEVEVTAGGESRIPVFGLRHSGIEIEVLDGGMLRMQWKSRGVTEMFKTSLSSGPPVAATVQVDKPVTHTSTRPAVPGTRLHVLGPVAGGRSAALLVSFTPLAQ